MRNLAPRLALFLLIITLATGISAAQTPDPSALISPDDVLSGLAAYVPQDTLFYASARTDAGSIAALDAAIAEVTDGLTGLQVPPLESLLPAIGLSPEEVRPWLGDAAGLVIVPSSINGSGAEPLWLLHVLDTEAASAYLLEQNPNLVITAQDDILLIAGTYRSDDIPVKTEFLNTLNEEADAAPLSTNPAFADLTQTLDAPAYAALIYADLPLLMARTRFAPFSYNGYFISQAPSYAAIGRVFGTIAVGVTRAEGGDLLLDIAMSAPNLAGIAPLGLRFEPPTVTPESLAYVPHDALAVVQGSDLPGFFIELWGLFGDNLVDTAVHSNLDFMTRYGYAPAASILQLYVLQEMTTDEIADLVLGNILGLTVDELHNWTAGDYVLFARVNEGWRPQVDEGTSLLQADVAGIFEIGDAEQSFAAFEKLVRTLVLLRDGAGVWEYIDIDVTRSADSSRVDVSIYASGKEHLPLTISLIVTNTVAILGTGEAVDAAFAQIGGEIAPWLADATANFREGAVFNGAVQPSLLLPVINAWIGGGDSMQQTLSSARPFIAKAESLAFNLAVAPSGALVARLGIRLNSAGAMETALGVPTLEPAPFATLPPLPTVIPQPTIAVVSPEATSEIDATIIAGVTQTVDAATAQFAFPTPTFPPSQTPEPTSTAVPSATPTAIPSPTSAPTEAALTFPTAPVTSAMFDLPTFRTDDGAFILGNPDAPVTLVIFSDWACPHCQDLNPTTLDVISRATADGAFNIEHRTLVTAGGNATREASHLAECVDLKRPGVFWEVREFLFGVAVETRGIYDNAPLLADALAARFEVDATAITACASSSTQLETDGRYALELQANSTPFVVVRAADGTSTVVTDRSLDGILAALTAAETAGETELQEAPPSGDSVQQTRAAGLANLAATRQAATPTP